MKLIFLVPNQPVIPESASSYRDLSSCELIDLNGNHWRKILTIVAKLSASKEEDWRIVRDKALWDRVEFIFDVSTARASVGWLFIVGKSFEEAFPTPSQAILLGDKHVARAHKNIIWTPYLDYRQFPNDLIDTLTSYMREHQSLC